jgi:hypothetical protein
VTDAPCDDPAQAARRLAEVGAELKKVVLGQEAVLEQVLVTLPCGGHALL